MLTEYKQFYEKNIINKELKNIDKNELIRLYTKTQKEEYLSAAIYKFWFLLDNKCFLLKNNPYIFDEDLYNIYIDAILETCEKKLWENEKSSLYNDNKAPEKAINTLFKCRILNKYAANNRYKRKANYTNYIYELTDADALLEITDNDFDFESKSIDLVVDFFTKKDYYTAYILDLILHDNVFIEEQFNLKKLKHLLMTLDNSYFIYFSDYYGIDLQDIEYSKKYLTKSYSEMDKKINKVFLFLSRNEELNQFLERSR